MWKIIIGLVILALVIGGGFLYYRSTKVTNSQDNVKENTPEVTTEPSATPTPEEVKKDQFTIRILNGSGIAGEAGRAQELLEGAEFKVDSTGNADNYDYEETVIQVKESVSLALVEALKSTLGQKYSVKSSTDSIEDGVEADVVVVIGKLDKDGDSMVIEETNTPTPSNKPEETNTPSPSPSPSPTGV